VGKRHPNPRLVKIHRSYSVEEIARLFGIHKNTVRAWVTQGFEAIDKKRPIVVHGKTLAAFLTARRVASKRPCPPGYIYCLPCRAPKSPAGNMAEYVPGSNATGNLRGICPDCDRHLPEGKPDENRSDSGESRGHVHGGTTAHKGERRPLR
jgi:hypothetical protein